ncbi:MAG: hypothetical protein Q9183_001168 [Haloplaca sp. 2 TL-2023]
MSKSHTDSWSRILLNDSAMDIRSKIKGALTDSIEAMDKQKRSEEQLVADVQTLSMRAFKEEVSDTVVRGLADIKDRYDYFSDFAQSQLLQEIIASGNAKARSKAQDTMVRVRSLVGVENIE